MICEALVFLSCFGAVVCNILLLVSCEVLNLQAPFQGRKGTLGLFKWGDPDFANGNNNDGGDCFSFGDDDSAIQGDTAFRVAQVGSTLSFAFGSIILVSVFFKQCLCKFPGLMCLLDMSATGVQISLALVYCVWLSEICDDYSCVSGDGMVYLWLTQGLWFFAGCFARCMREGRQERNRDTGGDKD